MSALSRVARHNFSPKLFPIRMRIFDESTNELVWERVITLEEATSLAAVKVPGFGKEGRKVRCETTDATGHVCLAASDGAVSEAYDPAWPADRSS